MVRNYDKIKPAVDKYLAVLQENHISIEKVFLFGSYAKNIANEYSDIDIALISKDFSGNRFLDRRKLIPLRRNIDVRLEPIPFHPDNFKENDPLAIEIMSTGIPIDLKDLDSLL